MISLPHSPERNRIDCQTGHGSVPGRFNNADERWFFSVVIGGREIRQIHEIVRRHLAACDLEYFDEGLFIRHPLAGRITAYSGLRFSNTAPHLLVAASFTGDPVAELHAKQIP